MTSELSRFKHKSGGSDVGMMRPFKVRGEHKLDSDINLLESQLRTIESKFGAKNIKSVFLHGGAVRFLRGSEENRSCYGDLDLIVVLRKGAKIKKHINTEQVQSILLTEGALRNIRSPDWKEFSLIEGIPIYNREEGIKIQQKLVDQFVKRIGKKALKAKANTWKRDVRRRTLTEKDKREARKLMARISLMPILLKTLTPSKLKSISFLTPFLRGARRRK